MSAFPSYLTQFRGHFYVEYTTPLHIATPLLLTYEVGRYQEEIERPMIRTQTNLVVLYR